jgi:glycosyltransferase involved in cell wall biosynthesis
MLKIPVVCHLCDFKAEYGGSFIESLIYLHRYCRRNLQVGLFCVFPENARNKTWMKRLNEESVQHGFVPRKKNVLGHVRLLLKNYDPVILHTHFFYFDLSAILMKVMFFHNSRIVWHYHNPALFTIKQRIKDAFKIRLIFNRLGDRCIAVGDGVYKSIREAGMAKEKTVLIYNGVNIARFRNKSEDSAEVGQGLLISTPIVFLLLGWDPVRKGVDIFLRAAEDLCSRNYINCRFLIVGRTETRKFVSQLASTSKLSENLKLIDPVEDMSVLLRRVDVFVSSSRSEGFGFAVVEAMAAEKLVLCSDINPVRETYGRSKGVWLFPSEDWRMLAQLMENVLLLPLDQRQSLARVNSQYALENYSLDRWSEDVGQLYKELIQT